MFNKIDIETRARKDIEIISGIGRNDKTGGFTRLAWSPEETAVHEYFQSYFNLDKYSVWWDDIGNTHVRLNATEKTDQTIYVISHGDSVKNGGTYDGIVGIIVAKECLLLLDSLEHRRFNLEMVIFRGEESSRWKKPYLGSLASLGQLDQSILKRADDEGTTLESAILQQGFEISPILEKRLIINVDNIQALFELHIEQSPVLYNKGLDFGIGTAIRGPYRMEVEISGEYDHSGGTPMNMRRDSVRAFTHLSHRIERIGQEYLKEGSDLVWTIPYIHTDVNSEGINKIPGYVKFGMDIRSYDKEIRTNFVNEVRNTIAIYANKNNAQYKIVDLSDSDPINNFDEGLQSLLEEAAVFNDQKYTRLPSGPGHDCGVFAKTKKKNGEYVPVGLGLIPCREGKSHCPLEFTEYRDIVNGVLNIIYVVEKKISS